MRGTWLHRGTAPHAWTNQSIAGRCDPAAGVKVDDDDVDDVDTVVVVDAGDESASGVDTTIGETESELSARRRMRASSSSSSASRARMGDKSETSASAAMMLPSFIWDYFVKEPGGKYVVCTLCPDQTTRFAYSGGTSTMNRHLRKKHQKYAPGKCAADYEYAKAANKRAALRPTGASAAASSGALAGAAALGGLSPTEAGRRQLIDLRNSRRRASTKRRKLLHPALLEPTDASASDFDPSAFGALGHPHAHAASPGAGLHLPPGFELGDGAMDFAGDPRFFDYATLAGGPALGLSAGGSTGALALSLGPGRARRAPATSNSSNHNNSSNSQSHKVLTHRLLKYLIAQYEPLDASRMGMELNVLLYGTDYPSTRLPSESALKLALANLYYSQRESLKDVIAEVELLSLSLNNWQSVFGQNVLTVSGHWISNGFSRRDCVLEVYVLPLDESVNTIALLRDVMDKWDIPANKVAALTMIKNGKEEAIHEEYPGLAVVNCFVNVLDSAVTAGLLKCALLIRRCRNYVSYFIQNPSEYQIFLSLQRKVAEAHAGLLLQPHHDSGAPSDRSSGGVVGSGGPSDDDDPEGKAPGAASPKFSGAGMASTTSNNSSSSAGAGASGTGAAAPVLSVICDFEDRWNSTSEMICRIVELEQMLVLYKHGLESDTNPNRRPMQLRFVCCELSTEEWANLKELARLLEPIEGVVHVSKLEYPGLSIIYPLLHSIKKHLDDAERWIATPLVAAVRNAIASGLTMQLCSSGAAPSSPYLSSLLDPRFKSLPFLDSAERARIVDMLKLLHAELIGGDKDSKDDLHPHDKKHAGSGRAASGSGSSGGGAPLLPHHSVGKKATGLLHEFFPLDEPTTELEKLTAQVQQYLESPSLPATDESENDPLEWWSRYQRMFPFLAKLAKKYLCISAVSLPFYEAFTNYGQLMREKKARLDIEVAAQILFCRSVSRIPEMDRMNV